MCPRGQARQIVRFIEPQNSISTVTSGGLTADPGLEGAGFRN